MTESPPPIAEIDVLWINAAGCDVDTIAKTAETHPSIE